MLWQHNKCTVTRTGSSIKKRVKTVQHSISMHRRTLTASDINISRRPAHTGRKMTRCVLPGKVDLFMVGMPPESIQGRQIKAAHVVNAHLDQHPPHLYEPHREAQHVLRICSTCSVALTAARLVCTVPAYAAYMRVSCSGTGGCHRGAGRTG